jgi:hypothetical protein
MTNADVPTFTTRIVSKRLKEQLPGRVKTSLGTKATNADRYSTKVAQLELARVKKAWTKYKSIQDQDRDGIYGYLQAVFDLISKWKESGDTKVAFHRPFERANHNSQMPAEPFAAVIFCTSDPEKVDDRTLSKWSRALRYVAINKKKTESLKKCMKRQGGINECASRFCVSARTKLMNHPTCEI